MTSHAANSNTRLGDLGSLVFKQAAAAGVIAIIVTLVVAWMGDAWDRFFRSWLMAFMFVLSLCLGALFFTILQHLSRAGWSVVVRRLAEGVMSNLSWIWILFIPVVIGLYSDSLYDWSDPAHHDEILAHKAGYLNKTFWMIRAVVFFGVWYFLARLLWKNSIAQDASGDEKITSRLAGVCAPAMIVYAVTQSFAAIDWMMSLEAHWFSTMFPVYYFAASACGFFSLLLLLMFWSQGTGRLRDEITNEHYHEVGKLLFYSIVFWAYIAFSQYMLIWYANIPEETTWYITRQLGGWLGVSLVLLFGHFVFPFMFIMSRYQKRRPGMIALLAGWMLLMCAVDIYWIVMPTVPAELLPEVESYAALARQVTNEDLNYGWHVLDFTCLIGLGALLLAGTAKKLSGVSLLPERDPRLNESLAFENF